MSKGRAGMAGSGYLGVGGKRTNQPNPELLKLKNEIEELQLEKEESRKNLLHFINELDEANKRNKQLQDQMIALQASKNNSQNQDGSTAETNGSLEGSVDNHDEDQSKLRQLEEQLSIAQRENEMLKQESEKQVTAREESKRRLEEQIQSMKEVNASLQSKIDSLETQFQTGTGHQTANVEQRLEAQKQTYEEESKMIREKVTMLEGQLHEVNSKLDQANAIAEQRAGERDHAKDSIEDLRLQIENSNKDNEAKNSKISSLETALEQAKPSEEDKKQLEQLKENVAALQAEIKKTKSADQDKSNKIIELEAALEESHAETKEKEQLLEKVVSVEAALAQTKEADEDKASKISTLEASLKERKSAVQEKEQLAEKVASLEAKLVESHGAETERQQLIEKVTSLESAVKNTEELALEKNKLTDKIASLESALEKSEDSEKEKYELKEKIATLQSSLEVLGSSENDSKRKGNTKESELSKKLTNLQKKLDNTNQERQNAEKNSAKKITKLQEQKKAAEEHAGAKQRDIDDLNRQIEELRSSNEHDANNNAQLLSDKQNAEKEYQDLKAKHESLLSQLAEATSKLEVFDKRGQEAEEVQLNFKELNKVVDELKSSMQADIDAAESEKREILADVEQHLEKIAKLEEIELELMNKLENSETISEEMGALLTETRKERDELAAWRTEREALHQQQEDNHVATQKELSTKIEELNELLTQEKEGMLSASQLLSSLEDRLSSAEATAKKEGMQYKESNESLKFAIDTINQRGALIVELEAKLESVNEKLESATKHASKLEKDRSNLAEEIVAYKSQLSELTGQLVTIQQEAKEAMKQHDETLDAQKEEHKNRIEVLENKLAKAVSVEVDLNNTITHLNAGLKSGQEQSEASKLASDELKKQFDEARSAIMTADGETKDLRDELAQAKDTASKEISELKNEREDALNDAREIEHKLAETKKKVEQLESEKVSLGNTLQSLLDEARKEIHILKSELADSSKQAEKHLELITNLEQELKSAKSESGKAATEMEQVFKENQRVKERIESAEEEMRNIKAENEKLLKEANNHDKTMEDIKGREVHLRLLNKTLQDEIRKLSRPNYTGSSQVSPASRSETQIASDSSSPSNRLSFSTPGKTSPSGTPPEVNTEYLKNIMIKFVEDKRTRSRLIPVLATMLNFTPEETQRLQSKV